MRKKAWDESGVAEVVGTILILAMTVVLFSGIILWVSSFPAPEAALRLEMEGVLEPIFDAGGAVVGANITITHRGGEVLLDFRTEIIRVIDDGTTVNTQVFKTAGMYAGQGYGLLDGSDGHWNINERWSLRDPAIDDLDATVTITIVDTIRSAVVWQSNLQPIVGKYPPFFLEIWADGDTSTLKIDTPRTDLTFGLFARVLDQDGDLDRNSIWVEFTFGPGGFFQLYDDGTNGDRVANDGVFSRLDSAFKPFMSWDSGILLFNATDFAGHTSSGRLILQVERGTGATGGTLFGGTWNSTLGGIGQGDSGPEGDYGYNIFDETGLPTEGDPSGTPTRIFQPGETVYVIARSTELQNLENINTFILRNSTGAKLYPPTKEFNSRDPTKNDPAFTQTATSPYFEYRYQFAAPITVGAYSVEFTLKDNAGSAAFFATDKIWVSTDGTTPVDYPKILTYRDPNNDGDLSDLVPETTFKTTELMYVRVFVKDVDLDPGACTPWFSTTSCPVYVNANAGDVEIQDYYGAVQVKKKPGNSPVSKISTFAYDQQGESTYVFYVDLLRRNQDPWVPGTNFYTLRIRSIADSGYASTTPESYQMLATQIEVIAPLSTIDIVGATEGGAAGGDDDTRGVYWYENSFYWREHPIDVLPEESKKPLAMATGDLNGDTKVDVVIGLDAKEITNIVAYFNLDYGITWRREFINQFQDDDNYRAESLAIGDLDGDGDGEIVAGIRDQGGTGVGVIIFWNDGNWSSQQLRYSEGGNVPNMRSLAIGDINNDGRPDIVAGDKNGVVNYYCNNVRGSYLPGSTDPCAPQTSLQPPGAVESFSQGVLVGTGAGIQYNSLRLGKMEGISEDLNPSAPGADQTLDIVVSNNKDLIIYRTDVMNGVPIFVRYDLQYTGDQISRNIESLAVGDMNNDGMLDIVVGIDPPARQSGIYRIRNMGMTGSPTPTFNTWESDLLPHTVIDPDDGNVADLGRIKDIALGDTDGDGDLDIVFISENEHSQLNNLWHIENVGDDPTTYIETNVFTDGWFKRKEKAFAVEMDYIDL